MSNPQQTKDPLKDLQVKLKLLSAALIEERKKSSSLLEEVKKTTIYEKQNNDLKSQLQELERIINEKENDNIKLSKENFEMQNALSIKNSQKGENVSESSVTNIIGNIFQINKTDPVSDLRIKKLQEENDALISEKRNIENEYNSYKTKNDVLLAEKDKIIEELKKDNNKYINEISEKNKILSENVQRMEIMAKSLSDFDSIKKQLNEKIEKLSNENNELINNYKALETKYKDLEINAKDYYENWKKAKEESLNLALKADTYKYDMLRNSTSNVYRFKCDEIISENTICTCYILFGISEDKEYVILFENDKNKEDRRFTIDNVEYLKIVDDPHTTKKNSVLEISVIVIYFFYFLG